MDVSDASYYIQENNENKGSRMGHTKKIFFRKKKKKKKKRVFTVLLCVWTELISISNCNNILKWLSRLSFNLKARFSTKGRKKERFSSC
jgi:hypothetical protein